MRIRTPLFVYHVAEEGTPQGGDETATTPTQETAPKGLETGPADDAPDGLPTDTVELQKMIDNLRKENAKTRVNAKQQAADEARDELVAQFAQVLGLVDDEPTVEDLQERITTQDAELNEAKEAAKQANTRLAVYQAAARVNADAELLLDSVRFQASLADVDLTDSAAVETAIRQWVQDHPKFGAMKVGASTIDAPGGSGEKAITEQDYQNMSLQEKADFARANRNAFLAFQDNR